MYSNDCNNSSLRIIFAKTNLGMFRVAKNMVVTIVKFTNLSYAMSGAVLCNWNCFLNFICFLIAMMDAILKIDMNIDGSKNWKTESKMYSTVTCSVEVISSLEKNPGLLQISTVSIDALSIMTTLSKVMERINMVAKEPRAITIVTKNTATLRALNIFW